MRIFFHNTKHPILLQELCMRIDNDIPTSFNGVALSEKDYGRVVLKYLQRYPNISTILFDTTNAAENAFQAPSSAIVSYVHQGLQDSTNVSVQQHKRTYAHIATSLTVLSLAKEKNAPQLITNPDFYMHLYNTMIGSNQN